MMTYNDRNVILIVFIAILVLFIVIVFYAEDCNL